MPKIVRYNLIIFFIVLVLLYFGSNKTRNLLNETYDYFLIAPWYIKIIILISFIIIITWIIKPKKKIRSLKLNKGIKSFKIYEDKYNYSRNFFDFFNNIRITIEKERIKGSNVWTITKKVILRIYFDIKPALYVVGGFILGILFIIVAVIILDYMDKN